MIELTETETERNKNKWEKKKNVFSLLIRLADTMAL